EVLMVLTDCRARNSAGLISPAKANDLHDWPPLGSVRDLSCCVHLASRHLFKATASWPANRLRSDEAFQTPSKALSGSLGAPHCIAPTRPIESFKSMAAMAGLAPSTGSSWIWTVADTALVKKTSKQNNCAAFPQRSRGGLFAEEFL